MGAQAARQLQGADGLLGLVHAIQKFCSGPSVTLGDRYGTTDA